MSIIIMMEHPKLLWDSYVINHGGMYIFSVCWFVLFYSYVTETKWSS